jgi:hypothetical protein
MTFAAAGAQSSPAVGKGAKYLTFPAARSCSTHTVDPTIATGKGAKKVKRIDIYVAGQRVAKVKKPHPGQALAVPLADDVDAEVSAELTLKSRHKHKPKVLKVAAAYAACTV